MHAAGRPVFSRPVACLLGLASHTAYHLSIGEVSLHISSSVVPLPFSSVIWGTRQCKRNLSLNKSADIFSLPSNCVLTSRKAGRRGYHVYLRYTKKYQKINWKKKSPFPSFRKLPSSLARSPSACNQASLQAFQNLSQRGNENFPKVLAPPRQPYCARAISFTMERPLTLIKIPH